MRPWIAIACLLAAPARADVSVEAAAARPPVLRVYPLAIGAKWIYATHLREWRDRERRVPRLDVRGRLVRTVVGETRVGRGLLFRTRVRVEPPDAVIGVSREELLYAIDRRIYEVDSVVSARAIDAGDDGREPLVEEQATGGCVTVENHNASSQLEQRFCDGVGPTLEHWNHFAGSQIEETQALVSRGRAR